MFKLADIPANPPRIVKQIQQSPYISRDLSWVKFNDRVLDQARRPERPIFDKLKFIAITASNLNEFFMVRVGSLYNYLDYNKERIDYSGLREKSFRMTLLRECQRFYEDQQRLYHGLQKDFYTHGFSILKPKDLTETELKHIEGYFTRTIYPMLTPMLYDGIYHSFPTLVNKALTLAVFTSDPKEKKKVARVSFVQIPQNLPRFYTFERGDHVIFVPIEEIVRTYVWHLFKNVTIDATSIFQLTRNADVTIADIDDIEIDFVEEVIKKLSTRRTARVVKVEVEDNCPKELIDILKEQSDIDRYNIFSTKSLLDLTGLFQIVGHPEFKEKGTSTPNPVKPLTLHGKMGGNVFDLIRDGDIFLHHPYNSMEILLELLEEAAEDPQVLALKITIYRLAKSSRVTQALLKAAQNGKHVSVLFEVKARFDEENNIREAQKLQEAGCYVIYGVGKFKTHTKLMMIVRKEANGIRRYVHMSSGNYNEQTARLYTDTALLSANEDYANEIAEVFNHITGHSKPGKFKYIIISPDGMPETFIELIQREAENARQGKASGIVLKINSLEDKAIIDELYKASGAGVPIELIVRGICCLRPGRQGMSENIRVISLVGELLEHSRLYYFHNAANPVIYGGSADFMNRSFDRRVEAVFMITDEASKKEAINILAYNLKGNANAYMMQENGDYLKVQPPEGTIPFNIHKEFFKLKPAMIEKAALFVPEKKKRSPKKITPLIEEAGQLQTQEETTQRAALKTVAARKSVDSERK